MFGWPKSRGGECLQINARVTIDTRRGNDGDGYVEERITYKLQLSHVGEVMLVI